MGNRENEPNYYDILHVQRSAPAAIIKNAYRAMMQSMKLHPDLGGDVEKAARVNEAYAVLSNETKRAEYDQALAARNSVSREETATANSAEESQTAASQRNFRDAQNAYGSNNGSRCSFCYKFHNAPSGELMDCSGCGSPLDPPPTGLNTENATRSIERISKNSHIQVTENLQSKPMTANLKDLSPQGLGFVLNENLNQQQVVKVGCQLFEGVATIVHKRTSTGEGNFYGAQFITLRFHNQSGNFISARL